MGILEIDARTPIFTVLRIFAYCRIFGEGGKPEDPEKNPSGMRESKHSKQTQFTYHCGRSVLCFYYSAGWNFKVIVYYAE